MLITEMRARPVGDLTRLLEDTLPELWDEERSAKEDGDKYHEGWFCGHREAFLAVLLYCGVDCG